MAAKPDDGDDPPEDGADRPRARGPGRAKELVRGPRRPRPAADTGRQHHLGAAPAGMPVLGQGPAAKARTTRAAAVQLADRTRHELALLEAAVAADMARAAADLDFETAAWHRDELGHVRDEIARRP